MILHNTIVTFTVTIPEIKIDSELGLVVARDKIYCEGRHSIKLGDGEISIKDCPDYPALCN